MDRRQHLHRHGCRQQELQPRRHRVDGVQVGKFQLVDICREQQFGAPDQIVPIGSRAGDFFQGIEDKHDISGVADFLADRIDTVVDEVVHIVLKRHLVPGQGRL